MGLGRSGVAQERQFVQETALQLVGLRSLTHSDISCALRQRF